MRIQAGSSSWTSPPTLANQGLLTARPTECDDPPRSSLDSSLESGGAHVTSIECRSLRHTSSEPDHLQPTGSKFSQGLFVATMSISCQKRPAGKFVVPSVLLCFRGSISRLIWTFGATQSRNPQMHHPRKPHKACIVDRPPGLVHNLGPRTPLLL